MPMKPRICKYAPCSVEFVPKHASQVHHSVSCRTLYHLQLKRKASSTAPVIEHASFKARGIVQDDIHPNDRGRDMTQYVGTFKIDDEGRVLTR